MDDEELRLFPSEILKEITGKDKITIPTKFNNIAGLTLLKLRNLIINTKLSYQSNNITISNDIDFTNPTKFQICALPGDDFINDLYIHTKDFFNTKVDAIHPLTGEHNVASAVIEKPRLSANNIILCLILAYHRKKLKTLKTVRVFKPVIKPLNFLTRISRSFNTGQIIGFFPTPDLCRRLMCRPIHLFPKDFYGKK